MAVNKWLWTQANPSTIHSAAVNQYVRDTSRYRYTDYENNNGTLSWPQLYFRATAEQVAAAYAAITNQGVPANFNQRVWNDLVDKIVELQIDWEVPATQRLNREDTSYPYYNSREVQGSFSAYISSAEPGYVQSSIYEVLSQHYNFGKTLRANKFNICVNAFVTLPGTWEWLWTQEGKTIQASQKAYGRYILELVRAINHWCDQEKLLFSPILDFQNILNVDPNIALADSYIMSELVCEFPSIITPNAVSLDYLKIIPDENFLKTFAFPALNIMVLEYDDIRGILVVDTHTNCNEINLGQAIQTQINLPFSTNIQTDGIIAISTIPLSSSILGTTTLNGISVLLDVLPTTTAIGNTTEIDVEQVGDGEAYPTTVNGLLFPTTINAFSDISSALYVNAIDISVDFVYNNINVEDIRMVSLSEISDTFTVRTIADLSPGGNFIEFTVNTAILENIVAGLQKSGVRTLYAENVADTAGYGTVTFASTVEFRATSFTQLFDAAQMRASCTFEFDTVITDIELTDVATARCIRQLEMDGIEANITTDNVVSLSQARQIELFADDEITETDYAEPATKHTAGTLTAHGNILVQDESALTNLRAITNLRGHPELTVRLSEQIAILRATNPLIAASTIGYENSADIYHQRLVNFAATHQVSTDVSTEFTFLLPTALHITDRLREFVVTTRLEFQEGVHFAGNSNISETTTVNAPDFQQSLDLGTAIETSRSEVSADLETERSTAWHNPRWEYEDGILGLTVYQVHTTLRQRDYTDRIRIDAMWEQEINIGAGTSINVNSPTMIAPVQALEETAEVVMTSTSQFDQSGWKYPYRLAGTKIITFYQAHHVAQDGDTVDIETENP